jgi:hypothetical protein
MKRRVTSFIAAGIFGLMLPLTTEAQAADALPKPAGVPLLEVSGDIKVKNGVRGAVFDLQMLRDLAEHEYVPTPIWTEGVQPFTGVPLAVLLDRLDVEDGTLMAKAINDYAIEIPVEDIDPQAPMGAYMMNGQEMSRRDKGPLWIVYPYDSDAKYRAEIAYARSIWQLDRIAVIQ